MQKKHYRFKKLKIKIIKTRGKNGRKEKGKKGKLHRTAKAKDRGRGL